MRCERFILFLLLFAACSKETPAPPPAPAAGAPSPPAAVSTVQPVAAAPAVKGTYEEGLNWFRSTGGFRFVLDDEGVHAEGKMTRKTVGAESVELRANGVDWRASAGARGVTWERRNGATWTKADTPDFGNRIYQRITLGVDPQKVEGAAQLAGTAGTSNHFRFTNANSGAVHEVWVAQSDSHLERMKIGDSVDLKITP